MANQFPYNSTPWKNCGSSCGRKMHCITLPRCPVTPREMVRTVIEYMNSIGVGIEEILFVQESHADADDEHTELTPTAGASRTAPVSHVHLHGYIKTVNYAKPVIQRGEGFAMGNYKGKYKPCSNKRGWLEYITKENLDYHEIGISHTDFLKRKQSKRELYHCSLDNLKDRVAPRDIVATINGRNLMKLLETKNEDAEDVRGIWIWGVPGAGKSHHAREIGARHGGFYLKPQNKWWDGYEGEPVVIIDDLDTPCLNHMLKLWADKWATKGETKGGVVPLCHEKLVVTSNYSIQEIVSRGCRGDECDPELVQALNRRFEVFYMNEVYVPTPPEPPTEEASFMNPPPSPAFIQEIQEAEAVMKNEI